MKRKDLKLSTVAVGTRGSKRGWVKVTTELPPERFEDLERARTDAGKNRSTYLFDLIDPNLPRAA